MYKLLTAILILSICSASTLADENDPCETPDSSETNIDVAYNYVNTKFCQPAIWFDSFFVDPRVTEDARAGTMIRWYQDITWEESESTQYDMKLSARVNLPRVTKKLKLVIESDDEDAYVDSLNEDTDSTVGLTYDIKAKADTSFTVKATLRPSVELRYRYTEVWNEQTLTRFTQKIYQKKKVTGVSTNIDLDYSINQTFLIRWGGVAKYESDIKNVELATGSTLYQYISKHSALSYNIGLTWFTKPSSYLSNTHFSVVYRQNILRKWLFYELIPEVNWEKEDELSHTKQIYKFTLRLEVLFENI